MKIRHLTKTLGHYDIQGARAIDGDTLEAVILLPFGALHIARLRLAGWWAPELNGPNPEAGKAAQAALQEFVSHNVVTIFSRSERRDKYGRFIVSLWASGKPVQPQDVLGLWAITEAQHKAENDWVRTKGRAELAMSAKEPGTPPPASEAWLHAKPSVSATEASAYGL